MKFAPFQHNFGGRDFGSHADIVSTFFLKGPEQDGQTDDQNRGISHGEILSNEDGSPEAWRPCSRRGDNHPAGRVDRFAIARQGHQG